MKIRRLKIFFVFSIILLITVGFAVISSNLKINGSFRFATNEWNIYFDNIQVDSGGVSTTKPKISSDKLSLNFSISLKEPEEYYLFYVDAVNKSSLNAMINEVKIEGLDEVSDYLECNVTYQDGSVIEKNDILYKDFSNTFKVEFKYKDITKEQIPSTDLTPTVIVSINYRQANKDAILKENTNFVNFNYSGAESTYIIPYDGTYKLEVWGGQGRARAAIGGYGGYSTGKISLIKQNKLYLTVGEAGLSIENESIGGSGIGHFRGGGATHISITSGLLKSLEDNQDSILIVAGGGGGNDGLSSVIPSGGGYMGVGYRQVLGGSQTVSSSNTVYSGSFGQGGDSGFSDSSGWPDYGGSGGGGYYGGDGSRSAWEAGAGGSGYIGNPNLTDKIMYCYNCQESTSEEDETNIKTRSTSNVSEIPTSNYAKIGNGYARISLVSVS